MRAVCVCVFNCVPDACDGCLMSRVCCCSLFQYTIGTVGGAAAAVGAGLGVSYVMMKQALFFSVYLLLCCNPLQMSFFKLLYTTAANDES